MPVTLKTGVMKYRKSDGMYSVMDALMPEQTQDQIAAIETAGQEQIDAVEQKGQDILDNLPEDYTELEADVGGLKSAINDLEEGSLSALGATAGQVPVADGLGSWAWGAQAGGMQTIQVSGTTPAITAVANTQYICGEVATLDITLPASGCVDVMFQSGSTPTVLTVTPPSGVTEVEWADGFDPDNLSANSTYWLKIIDGKLGIATAWGVQSGGGGEKPWNHAHFEVTDASEQTTAFIIPNNEAVSEILVRGKALFDSYDGVFFFINNIGLLGPYDSLSNTSCYFQIYGKRIAADMWIGRGNVGQWGVVPSLLGTLAKPAGNDSASNGIGDIKIASRWTDKIYQVGTDIDVYWR